MGYMPWPGLSLHIALNMMVNKKVFVVLLFQSMIIIVIDVYACWWYDACFFIMKMCLFAISSDNSLHRYRTTPCTPSPCLWLWSQGHYVWTVWSPWWASWNLTGYSIISIGWSSVNLWLQFARQFSVFVYLFVWWMYLLKGVCARCCPSGWT